LDFATLWEAMPWSWLIDWGSNVGDYLKAHRNIVPAELQSVSLMEHSVTQAHIPASVIGGDLWISQIDVMKETKTRRKVIVAPTAHFPFLTGNQLGILASLAITRT